jgi:lipopolysaccharide transport protein LptA
MILILFIVSINADTTTASSEKNSIDTITVNNEDINGNNLTYSDSHLKIDSGKFSVDLKKQTAVFFDNVTIENDYFKLTSDKVFLDRSDNSYQSFIAEGNVRIDVMDTISTSSKVQYWPKEQKLILMTPARVETENQILKGDNIEIIINHEIECRKNCSVEWK